MPHKNVDKFKGNYEKVKEKLGNFKKMKWNLRN